MQFQFSFKHMDASPALSEYAQHKILERTQKFTHRPANIAVHFRIENQWHIASCGMNDGKGGSFHAEHRSHDMYAAVDRLVDKLEAQMRRSKEKKVTMRVRSVSQYLGKQPAEDESYLEDNISAL